MPRFLHRVCSGTQIPYTPDSNCKLWLPGQDDAYSSIIRDRSGNGNNGTITGAVWAKNSRGIWYLNTDGSDDQIVCTGTGLAAGSAARTMEFWANVDALGITTGRTFFARGEYLESKMFALSHGNADLALLIVTHSHNFISTLALVVGTWTYYAATLNGTAVSITVNSVTQTGTLDATPNTSASDVYWCSRLGAAGTWMDTGIILQRAHTRVLTTAERLSHYNSERGFFGV